MRALLVYESRFGNTESVARAVAAGLGTVVRVDIHTPASAPVVLGDDVALLVVGAPTHALGHGVPEGDGVDRYACASVRDWLETLHPAGIPAASFDTHAGGPFTGRPARTVSHRLRRLGLQLRGHESFCAKGVLGPMEDGELDHAQRWGENLAASLAPVPS
ncbi:flavodoxin family protein [Kineosporia sp. J2-2]|uniref:Flavodoxin family protein n=1 Tax=Kineosporia corallincola TaxID=2835133 RepID=A0ABS5TR75_9ACTN|nr:hypothetical protein [Kineosporia corallincola]MBT0773218.1 flavodoxin family protein [Kineosporia corallincola]